MHTISQNTILAYPSLISLGTLSANQTPELQDSLDKVLRDELNDKNPRVAPEAKRLRESQKRH